MNFGSPVRILSKSEMLWGISFASLIIRRLF